MKTTLYIDNQAADADVTESLSVTLSLDALTSLEWGRASYSKSMTIPATPLNRRLMGDCEQLRSAALFNAARHTARVESDGSVIIEGTVFLTQCRIGPEGYYKFNIIGRGKEWVLSAASSVRDLPIDYSVTLDADTVEASWTADTPVRFLPVARAAGLNRGADYLHTLSLSDYHPFLHAATLLRAVFASAGYEIVSDFLRTPLFESLYVSGRYSETALTTCPDKMNFIAARFGDSKLVAGNNYGRVYANALTPYYSVGNLVDTADAAETDSSGNTAEGVMNNGGCFGKDDTGRIRFVPSEQVTMCFEYHLKYQTEFKIKNRDLLTAYTVVRPYFGDSISNPLANPYSDRRADASLQGNFSYRVMVFDYSAGQTYRLSAYEVTSAGADMNNLQPSDLTLRTLCTFSARSAEFVHASSNPLVRPFLEYNKNDAYTTDIPSDWAIYDGYITGTGVKTVEFTFRSQPETVKPSAPKFFDTFYFGGAEAGMSMKVLKGTTIRPVFIPHPSAGSAVTFSSVADYGCSQLDLVAAFKQMFDLAIYTDTALGKVFIEPRRSFYGSRTVDWSDRVDLSRPIVAEELGADASRTFTLCYRGADASASAAGVDSDGWSASVDNIFASADRRVYRNPLFCTTVSASGVFYRSPSALTVCAGDTDSMATQSFDYLNFSPKVVRYFGLKPLPSGQAWGWPTDSADHYPFAAFACTADSPAEPFSLFFEDRDGVEGLHAYWDGEADCLNRSRRLTLYLKLYPQEVEELLFPSFSAGAGFRALYRLVIDGEPTLCRLEEIADYNPSAVSTRCVFVTDV